MAVTDEVKGSYELSTGGFVPEFDGTVREARFTFDNSYNNGEACLLELMVEPSADDAPEFGDSLDEHDGLYRLIYTCGKGWEPADKGATAQHESGRTRRWNKQSGMGLLLSHVAECDGAVDVLMERGPSTQADIWVGLKFRIQDKEFTFTDRDGEERSYSRRLPVEFHGVDEGDKPAAKKAPAKKAPAKVEADDATEAEGDGPTHKLSPKLRGQLKAIAVNADDHDAFMEEAFATITDGDDAFEAAVADEEFYLSLKAG